MRIYVDFDDCLSESARGFSDLAAELFGVHVPYEEMRFFNLQKAFSLTDEHRGHEVSVVTGRPFSSREPSRLWLDRHGLEDIRMYFLDKYGRESHRKENEYCLDLDDFYRMKFDYAVEDSPSAFRFFDPLPGLQVLVFDRPWNRETEFPGSNYRRCRGWDDIRKIIEG